jgi:hypothetical protein
MIILKILKIDILEFLSTSFGAFLGFLFALVVYWIGESNNKRKKIKYENQIAFDNLKRFSGILQSVCSNCRIQNDTFLVYSEALKNNPLDNTITLQFIASNDLERMTSAESSDLFKSFMIFDKCNHAKYKDYRNIFINADFIRFSYSDIILQDQKHLEFMYKDLSIVRDDLIHIAITIESLQRKIELKKPDSFKFDVNYKILERFRQIYLSLNNGSFADFEPYYTTFLIPLLEVLYEKVDRQLDTNEIIRTIANAITRLENVKRNTISHSSNFADFVNNKDILAAIQYLNDVVSKIDNIKDPNTT